MDGQNEDSRETAQRRRAERIEERRQERNEERAQHNRDRGERAQRRAVAASNRPDARQARAALAAENVTTETRHFDSTVRTGVYMPRVIPSEFQALDPTVAIKVERTGDLLRPVQVTGVVLSGHVGNRPDRDGAAAAAASAEVAQRDPGHLMALSLGGPHVAENQVPQDRFRNRWGEWRRLERMIGRLNYLYGWWNHAIADLPAPRAAAAAAAARPNEYDAAAKRTLTRFVMMKVICTYPRMEGAAASRNRWAIPLSLTAAIRIVNGNGDAATTGDVPLGDPLLVQHLRTFEKEYAALRAEESLVPQADLGGWHLLSRIDN